MPPTNQDRLKTLDSVAGLGLFKNFTWDSTQLHDFDRYNLMYGWNYSGKTTLSRVFQSVEDRGIHPDFSGATFQLTKGDGSFIDTFFTGALPAIRVFNREFVIRNFHSGADMTGVNLIAVIGEANQALKDRIESLQNRANTVSSFQTNIIEKRDSIQSSLNDAATAQARIVVAIVGGPYTRTHFLNHTVPSLPQESPPLPLSEADLNSAKEQFRRVGDFGKLAFVEADYKSFFEIVIKIWTALKEIATNTALVEFQENRNLLLLLANRK